MSETKMEKLKKLNPSVLIPVDFHSKSKLAQENWTRRQIKRLERETVTSKQVPNSKGMGSLFSVIKQYGLFTVVMSNLGLLLLMFSEYQVSVGIPANPWITVTDEQTPTLVNAGILCLMISLPRVIKFTHGWLLKILAFALLVFCLTVSYTNFDKWSNDTVSKGTADKTTNRLKELENSYGVAIKLNRYSTLQDKERTDTDAKNRQCSKNDGTLCVNLSKAITTTIAAKEAAWREYSEAKSKASTKAEQEIKPAASTDVWKVTRSLLPVFVIVASYVIP